MVNESTCILYRSVLRETILLKQRKDDEAAHILYESSKCETGWKLKEHCSVQSKAHPFVRLDRKGQIERIDETSFSLTTIAVDHFHHTWSMPILPYKPLLACAN